MPFFIKSPYNLRTYELQYMLLNLKESCHMPNVIFFLKLEKEEFASEV